MIGEITDVQFKDLKGDKLFREMVVKVKVLKKPTKSKTFKCLNYASASTSIAEVQNDKGQAGIVQVGVRTENPTKVQDRKDAGLSDD